jgi:hypothetical protein
MVAVTLPSPALLPGRSAPLLESCAGQPRLRFVASIPGHLSGHCPQGRQFGLPLSWLPSDLEPFWSSLSGPPSAASSLSLSWPALPSQVTDWSPCPIPGRRQPATYGANPPPATLSSADMTIDLQPDIVVHSEETTLDEVLTPELQLVVSFEVLHHLDMAEKSRSLSAEELDLVEFLVAQVASLSSLAMEMTCESTIGT